MKTIRCVVTIQDGNKSKTVADVEKEFPEEMTEQFTTRHILELASEKIPAQKIRHGLD